MKKYDIYNRLRQEGLSQSAIARIFNVTRQSVNNVFKRYEDTAYCVAQYKRNKLYIKTRYENDLEWREKRLAYIREWKQKRKAKQEHV